MEATGAHFSKPLFNSSDEEMTVNLQNLKTVSMTVKRSETVENIKAMVTEKEGISKDSQDLFLVGDGLQDGSRLIDYGVDSNCALQLIHQNLTGLKLFVKLPNKETPIELEATADHTVRIIKSLIQAKEGIDQSNGVALVYEGNLLEDGMTLASLNIKSESRLHLLFCPNEVLPIWVKGPAGDFMKLKVKAQLTIAGVKAIVGSITGVSASDQILSFAGKLLEDGKTLASYDIKEYSVLEMSPSHIRVYVKTAADGEIAELRVKVSHPVRDVKAIVAGMLWVSADRLDLFYAGIKLQDSRALASYDIKDGGFLEAIPVPVQIFVKTLSGKTITLDVRLCDTGKDVKRKIFRKARIPLKQQCIVFARKRIRDDRVLAKYNVRKHSTLHMICAPSLENSSTIRHE